MILVFRKLNLGKPKSCFDKCLEEGKGEWRCAAKCADGDGEGILEISFKWYDTFVYFNVFMTFK